MLNHILEISKRASKGGRVPIKIALLKIHKDEGETNRNGIHWKEEYVANAIDSVKMMPICAAFIDEDKSVPLDHGLTGEYVDENGVHEPLFENSETVGCFETAQIETINVNGNDIRALTAQGYLYNQRYPGFVKWVRENYAKDQVDTSIEIMGLDVNDNKIIYEEENPTDKFRTPKEFVFSGSCILSVQPADSDAIVLEIAQKNQEKEDKSNMEFDMNEIKTVIQTTISETNSQNEALSAQISELNAQLSEKDGTISELNATVEELKKAIADLENEKEGYWEEKAFLNGELGKLRAKERINKLRETIADFSDDEKKYAEAEINSFNENPLEGDVDAIVSKIYTGIGMASKKAAEEARVAEQNSVKEQNTTEVIDIFSEMCTETQSEDDDINIF